MKRDLLTSITCSVVFALTLAACGGKDSVSRMFGGAKAALLSGTRSSAHLVTNSASPLMAGFLQNAVAAPLATLSQSFDAICDSYNVQGAPQNAFVPIPSSGTACNTFVTVPSTVDGKRIHDPG